jgi:hypothetical protein
LIEKWGEIRPKQNRGEATARLKNETYTILRDLLKKGLTYYQQNPE